MPEIDPEFLDVDFDEQDRPTGALPTPHFVTALFSRYEDAVTVMSQSELRQAAEKQQADGGLEELVTRVFDQRSEGSCVGNATCAANQLVQAKQWGESEVVELSAISVYKQIGRSPGSGATVADGLRCIRDLGALPLDTPTNRQHFGNAVMPNTGFYERYPENWKETAARFRAVESHVVTTMDGLLTALARQEPVVVGRDGHSICYVRPVWDGDWKVIYVNSWGRWGFAYGDHPSGFGADTRGRIAQSARWAFVLRTLTGRQP